MMSRSSFNEVMLDLMADDDLIFIRGLADVSRGRRYYQQRR